MSKIRVDNIDPFSQTQVNLNSVLFAKKNDSSPLERVALISEIGGGGGGGSVSSSVGMDLDVRFNRLFSDNKITLSTNTLNIPTFEMLYEFGGINKMVTFASSTLNTTLPASFSSSTISFANNSPMDYYIKAGVMVDGVGEVINQKIFITNSISDTDGMDKSTIIGGFHYGVSRLTISTVSLNSIVPNSIWTKAKGAMPKCYLLRLLNLASDFQLGGMADIGGGLWVDIYLSSDPIGLPSGGSETARPMTTKKLYSLYGRVPLSGTENLNYFDFVNRAWNSGKRLLSTQEWFRCAEGSPAGNNGDDVNGWTKTSNTTRVLTGAITNLSMPSGYTAVSAGLANYYLGNNTSLKNIRDCVGNLYEWGGSISNWSTSPAWRDVMKTGESSTILSAFGQEYSGGNTVVPLFGGHWTYGVFAGSRSVIVANSPWFANTAAGCRCACDSL